MIRKKPFLKWIICPLDDSISPQSYEICRRCKHLVDIVNDGVLCKYEDEDDDDSRGEE